MTASRAPEISTTGSAVVTPHRAATHAALEVMAAGANAVGAMIAANAVLGVVAPETCGIGGDLFAIVMEPPDPPRALNASGFAGRGARAEELRSVGAIAVPGDHPLAITTPGCVRGWEKLLPLAGGSLADLLAPAIRIAAEGFPASAELCDLASRNVDVLADQPSARAWFPDGRPPEVGDHIRRPDLAATLDAIASEGADAFYSGHVGASIVEATGGRITSSDLAETRAEWVDPIGADVFGITGWTVPPNSQGYLTLAAAWLFEQLAPPFDPGDPGYWHLLVECYRAVAWERDTLVADPRYAPLSAERLLDPARLRPRLDRIDPASVAAWPDERPVPGGTAYLCAVDGDGRAVSLIQSNFASLGSGIGAGPHGFVLHNRGSGFTLEKGHPNELAPGKRPLHTLSPTLWTRGAGPVMVLGTRGARYQPQILVQMVGHLLGAGLAPGEAIASPRWVTDLLGPGGESRIQVESAMDPSIVDGLRRRGHTVEVAAPRRPDWGPVSSVIVGHDGARTAVADPRVDTALAAGLP